MHASTPHSFHPTAPTSTRSYAAAPSRARSGGSSHPPFPNLRCAPAILDWPLVASRGVTRRGSVCDFFCGRRGPVLAMLLRLRRQRRAWQGVVEAVEELPLNHTRLASPPPPLGGSCALISTSVPRGLLTYALLLACPLYKPCVSRSSSADVPGGHAAARGTVSAVDGADAAPQAQEPHVVLVGGVEVHDRVLKDVAHTARGTGHASLKLDASGRAPRSERLRTCLKAWLALLATCERMLTGLLYARASAPLARRLAGKAKQYITPVDTPPTHARRRAPQA
eukprot:scaffold3450_cov323-Prasinococcus_capsulatus_cf.AAC.3